MRDEKVAQLLVRRDDSAETEKIILCYIRRTSQSFKNYFDKEPFLFYCKIQIVYEWE